MELTIKTFFSNYLLKPWEVEDPQKRKLAFAASIILGLASAWTIHMGAALVKYAIIPLAEKVGVIKKVDDIREQHIPIFEQELSKKNVGEISLRKPIYEQTQTKEAEKAVVKTESEADDKKQGLTEKKSYFRRFKELLPSRNKSTPDIKVILLPQPEEPDWPPPPPKDWKKAERNMRASDHPQDLLCAALLDVPHFRENCVTITKEFLQSPEPFKSKLIAFREARFKLMANPDNTPPPPPAGKKYEKTNAAWTQALWLVLKKDLTEKEFSEFQQWFVKEQGLDSGTELDTYGEWFHLAGALEGITYQENIASSEDPKPSNTEKKTNIPNPTSTKKAASPPRQKEPLLIPHKWEKVETYLRTSSNKEDISFIERLDNSKFRQGCVDAAKALLSHSSNKRENQLDAFLAIWQPLLNNPEAVNLNLKDDSALPVTYRVLAFALKKELTASQFSQFQNWVEENIDQFIPTDIRSLEYENIKSGFEFGKYVEEVIDFPVPNDWERAKGNLIASKSPEDTYTNSLLESPQFRQGCVQAAEDFLGNLRARGKDKLAIFIKKWDPLLENADALPRVARPNHFLVSAHIALCFILKEELKGEGFAIFQDWFCHEGEKIIEESQNNIALGKDYSSKEHATCLFMKGGFSGAHYFENHNPSL